MEPCEYCKGTGHVRYDGNAYVPCDDLHPDGGPCHVCDNDGSASESVMYWRDRALAAEAKVRDIRAALTDYERRATSLLEVMRVAGCLEGK